MIELIPAIDIIDGKCVRLVQGDYDRKTEYSGNPLEIARGFEEMGIRRLHLVDLDGARAGHVVNLGVLREIAAGTGLVLDFGGGVKTREDLLKVLDKGASMVTAGSIAVRDADEVAGWLEEFGPDRIILGADVRENKIAVSGWQEDTEIDIISFIEQYGNAGAQKVICTDISRDGMLTGPAVELYQHLCARFPGMEIIASGGVSGMDDILRLEGTGVSGVIFGKAFYEGRISSLEIQRYMSKLNN